MTQGFPVVEELVQGSQVVVAGALPHSVPTASSAASAQSQRPVSTGAASNGIAWVKEYLNLLDPRWGVKGDGSTDDTSAVNSALAIAGDATDGHIYVPNPPGGFYKTTAALQIAQYQGLKIQGESWENTIFKQVTDNTPIIQFTTDTTHSVEITGLRLQYLNQQSSANTSAYAIAFSAGSPANGFYHLGLKRLKIDKAYTGIGTLLGAGSQPIWDSHFDDILLSAITGRLLYLKSPSAVGQPCNRITALKCLNDGTTSTQAAVEAQGEIYGEDWDIEAWTGRIYMNTSGSHTALKRMHNERHVMPGGGFQMYLASGGGTYFSLEEWTNTNLNLTGAADWWAVQLDNGMGRIKGVTTQVAAGTGGNFGMFHSGSGTEVELSGHQFLASGGGVTTTLYEVYPFGSGTNAIVNQDGQPVGKIAAPAYSASINVEAANGPWQTITVTNATAFTINNPAWNGNATLPASKSRELTIEVFNNSGGAMGVITWGAKFVFAGAVWANPANGKRRWARFEANGANWICTGVAAADY